jgi:hypothetical protein
MELELINLELELKIPTKHLIHKLIYHLICLIRNISSLTILIGITLFGVGIPSRYSEYLLMVKKVVGNEKNNWN